MLQFLIDRLTPIFEGMGVSAVDVNTYVDMLSGYIYGILAVIVVVIALLIAAHWIARKGKRHLIRWSSVVRAW